MGVETAPANKGRAPQSAAKGAATGPNSSKNPPANPPVRQFANQLQQDIEDVTVEVNTTARPHQQPSCSLVSLLLTRWSFHVLLVLLAHLIV